MLGGLWYCWLGFEVWCSLMVVVLLLLGGRWRGLRRGGLGDTLLWWFDEGDGMLFTVCDWDVSFG